MDEMRVSSDSAIWRASMRLGSFGGERTGGLDRIALKGIVTKNSYWRMPTIKMEGVLLALDPQFSNEAFPRDPAGQVERTRRRGSHDSFDGAITCIAR